MRSRPTPRAPDCAISGQLDRKFQVRLQFDRLAVRGLGGQAAHPRIALPLAREGRHRLARLCRGLRRRVEDHHAGRAVHDDFFALGDGVAQPVGPQDGGHAEGAQHHRRMSLSTALVGRNPGQPRRVEQCCVRRAQPLAHQHRAFGQTGEASERGVREVADDPARDLAHLLRPPRHRGAVVGREGLAVAGAHDRRGDRLGLLVHRRLGGQVVLRDPPLRPAHQPRRAEHALIGLQQRRDLRLAVLWQDAQSRA